MGFRYRSRRRWKKLCRQVVDASTYSFFVTRYFGQDFTYEDGSRAAVLSNGFELLFVVTLTAEGKIYREFAPSWHWYNSPKFKGGNDEGDF